MIVSQVNEVEAVQLQFDDVVTATVLLPPAAGTDWLVGAIVKLQGAAACVTVNVLPPIVIVPVRATVVVFAAALQPTLPLPVPEAPVVTVSHASLLVAVQLHELAVTVIVPLPAAGVVRVHEVGKMVSVHGTPGCVTVNVWPPIVIVPLRDVEPVFAATL